MAKITIAIVAPMTKPTMALLRRSFSISLTVLNKILIFNNKIVFDQFTTVGFQLSASADAAITIAGKGASSGKSVSLVPGVSLYQLIDTGLVVQANWGGTEFLKDPNLNQ